MSNPYQVNEVDRAGNDYRIFSAETFSLALEELLTAHTLQPTCYHYIINSDQADVDSDGLTDEERELLP